MAEKLETIISRGSTNSRSKDFYDLYALTKLEHQNIDIEQLREALINTATHRKTMAEINDYQKTIADISDDADMNNRWQIYQRDNIFAKDISLKDTCDAVIQLMNEINWNR